MPSLLSSLKGGWSPTYTENSKCQCSFFVELRAGLNDCLRTNEIVTPHQTTLLKLVDSYLQSTQLNPTDIQLPDVLHTHESLGSFLAKRFFTLSNYAQKAMHRSLGMVPPSKDCGARHQDAMTQRTSSESLSSSERSNSSSAPSFPNSFPQELDVMLPKVCEALVLVTQCIVTICLEAEEQQSRLEQGISTIVSFTNLKTYFIQKQHDGVGVVESLIGMQALELSIMFLTREILDLLHILDIFLPRINFGKPVNADGTPASVNQPGVGESSGFSYLKRDLVRLLGVLCHGVRSVQDRTREAGGLPVVMNLCVIDERNPCGSKSTKPKRQFSSSLFILDLREHAIFTLHSLLKDNPENQQFVDSIKPAQEWDEDGTLKTRVGGVRR